MRTYVLGIVLLIFFLGCTHQINIGTISLSEHANPELKD
jgi:hypothetical protein